MDNASIGELVKMSLIYSGIMPNPWKAVNIEQKIDPVEINNITSIEYFMDSSERKEVAKMRTFHIPKQDIGKMVGKNGQNIRKIMKDYFYNNHYMAYVFHDMEYGDSDKWWDEADIPKFNIVNKADYTEVDIWYNSILDEQSISFDPIKDLFQKMYC